MSKEDCISMSKNVHKRIHLLHCNLKELHEQFCPEFDEIPVYDQSGVLQLSIEVLMQFVCVCNTPKCIVVS